MRRKSWFDIHEELATLGIPLDMDTENHTMCLAVTELASPKQPASSAQVPLHCARVARTRSSLWPELKVLETTLEEAVDFVRLHSARRGQHHAHRTPQPTHPCH